MNTYQRSQGMDNRLNMLFNQELDNEAQYIKSHPFSSINMSLGGEVRYIAPIWPWHAPRFKSIDWRTQPPPRRLPGETKHDQGKMFELPKTWNETTASCWTEDQKPPRAFPYKARDTSRSGYGETTERAAGGEGKGDYSVTMTGGAIRSQQSTARSERVKTGRSQREAKDPLSIDKPVSQLPGRSRPDTGMTDRSSRANTHRSHRSNPSARAAAQQLLK
uniref:Uncharacterized protein n=1 Tax=Hemiselmis tepida TaxID=464990 RepID=A0A7S0YQA6_9CRYP|mmetsp:Transcript_14083/g.35956  ORF Transcript_14083/g.35956 Transcript_14083/m.35956 type:complete len:219 (+) Transcript_14083:220-876(+)|eukprot:CAMPEP_0174930408 /NCGR_PEP_ID=MMETSP1355-20121228/31146_1 /TAXON_ID=464990 /ORGANISM="Hemiselmis tepida, Strain CCMP443" /LENGTH=218 /DNA_ID=CAMNT_0016176701 /DNA_START=198 /DNA_END=854 /DNA_ORIENTATION=+